MPVEVTLMTASVGCSIFGSGTLSTRTSRLPWNVTALIGRLQDSWSAGCYPLGVGGTAARLIWPRRSTARGWESSSRLFRLRRSARGARAGARPDARPLRAHDVPGVGRRHQAGLVDAPARGQAPGEREPASGRGGEPGAAATGGQEPGADQQTGLRHSLQAPRRRLLVGAFVFAEAPVQS